MMKSKEFTLIELDRIIEMAWEDRTQNFLSGEKECKEELPNMQNFALTELIDSNVLYKGKLHIIKFLKDRLDTLPIK
jgi:hypothetical protein